APPTTIYVKLINAATGALTATVAAQSNGSYQFTDVPLGTYHLFAGEDEESDGVVGVNPRRWSGYGSTAVPTTVTVAGPGTQTINFPVGYPLEIESNNTLQTTNVL